MHSSREASVRPAFAAALSILATLAALALPAWLVAEPAQADARRIVLDGDLADWSGATPVHVDPSGDGGSSGIDLGAIRMAHDEERFFIAFEVGADLVLSESNLLTLYLDTDNNAATGFALGFMGAELVWNFGNRNGHFFYPGGYVAITWSDLELLCGPTDSGPAFELAIARDALPDGVRRLFGGSSFRAAFRDQGGGGDWAPDMGTAISYAFDAQVPPPLAPIELTRQPGPMRLVTYNVLQDQLFDYTPKQSFRRILQAIEPDVVAFQEIYDHTATETRQLIESWLGGTWDAYKISDKVLVTRTSILAHYEIAGGRGAAYLISPLGDVADDILIIDVHLSCCSANSERQAQCDAIMAFIRDAHEPGGVIDLTADNPIVITGDTNFVGYHRQLQTLLTGDILDNATHGPDFAPDWDGSGLADRISRHVTEPVGYTWYKTWSDYWPSRLDYIISTDSNLGWALSGTLQTELLPASYLGEYGLQANDSGTASDHIPHFGDMVTLGQGVAELPPVAGGWRLSLAGPNPAVGEARLLLESARLTPSTGAPGLAILDGAGRAVRLLAPATAGDGRVLLRWDGCDGRGRPVAAGTYWARTAGARAGDGSALRLVLVR